MAIRLLASADDLAAYDAWIRGHPEGSLWQSVAWKTYQEALGRAVRVYVAEEEGEMRASALVIIDRTTGGFCTWDIPRGPLIAASYELRAMSLLKTILHDAQCGRCISLYLSPQEVLEAHDSKLEASSRHEQPEATRMLDLTLSDDALLAQMHQKGRYNIKVAQRSGVRVEQSQDIDAYHALATATAGRDGFRIPSKRQLSTFLQTVPGSFLLLAYKRCELRAASCEQEGARMKTERTQKTQGNDPSSESFGSSESFESSPIAGLIGVTWHTIGIYYYGASDYAHRALMAPYVLQWEAMRHCRAQGCTRYDLLGIAPPGAGKDHPWHGISAFKEKFGGRMVTYPPEQCMVVRPWAVWMIRMKRRVMG